MLSFSRQALTTNIPLNTASPFYLKTHVLLKIIPFFLHFIYTYISCPFFIYISFSNIFIVFFRMETQSLCYSDIDLYPFRAVILMLLFLLLPFVVFYLCISLLFFLFCFLFFPCSTSTFLSFFLFSSPYGSSISCVVVFFFHFHLHLLGICIHISCYFRSILFTLPQFHIGQYHNLEKPLFYFKVQKFLDFFILLHILYKQPHTLGFLLYHFVARVQ